ncbi:family 4 glycosyl hydrolase [Cellulosilyticum ruminicola]
MKFMGDKVKDIKITYIGGGSRGWAWSLMSDLAMEKQLLGTVKLYDIDYEAAVNNEKIGNALAGRDDVKSKWIYKVEKDLDEALKGADFVVISILPGTFNEMASDVHTPEHYGIYQSVGDTVGPGGLIRGLRTVPMYVKFAKAIEKNCPKAWVINYTNPMSICMKALYTVFPKIKAFGCCHEVFHTQTLLTHALKDLEGIEDVKREEIKVNVLGINHFTWLDHASYKNIDLMPIYKKFVDKYYVEGYETGKTGNWMNDSFTCANRVKFDLFRRYGLIAAAGDRHLAEFMQGNWYVENPETVMHWKFGLTTVSWRRRDLEKRLEKSRALVNGEKEFEIKPSGEDGVKQIKALLGLEDLVTNVNLPNQGQISNIGLGNIVETNALFRKDQVIPLMAGELPGAIQSIVTRHICNQNDIVEAALTKDRRKAFRAFANDPLVTLSLEDAKELFNQMIKNTEVYLEL